jgi:site-specific recombinase XerD
LSWLKERGMVRLDPTIFLLKKGRPTRGLPASAIEFVETLKPQLKRGTVRGYEVALRRFHTWLEEHRLELKTLTRVQTEKWLQKMSKSGFAPETINKDIISIRIYLRWLYERDELDVFPDELIRSKDAVKEPKHLPRPFPPQADKVIQERLKNEGDIYSLGLLLMRKTGIRNGELRDLKKDCIRCDELGNFFIKVPLGKLNTERLVPIDEETMKLIQRLRGPDEKARNKVYLIENSKKNKSRYRPYSAALQKVVADLETNGRSTTHRMRHTYATSLLNAGMSLVGVMKLLGHNDHRMTLRYAELTTETATKEYFEAMSKLATLYQHTSAREAENTFQQNDNPTRLLEQAMHVLTRKAADDTDIKPLLRNIVKRIKRIQNETARILTSSRIHS